MKLFEKIPASFFSILASPNRELYWTALVTLHHLLEYDLNIPVEDYCIALGDTLSDMELTAEDTLDEEEQRLIRQPNGKVRWIIHRLKRAGWLDTEYRDGTFEEVIAPRDYADQMIRLLLELEQAETKEYNSLVFSTYSGLKQAYEEKSDRMYEALLTARRNTTELLQDLKSLYHNIRYYHQIIGQAVDVNQLLHDYYDEYKGMLDRIYHPIKTMDSLPHYRQPILDILNALLVDDEIMERAVGRMVQLHPDEDPVEARRTLDSYIQELMSSYSNVEDILRQIDRKHRAYTRESVDSISAFTTMFLYMLRLIYEENRQQLELHHDVRTDTFAVIHKMNAFGLLKDGRSTAKDRLEAQKTLARYQVIAKIDGGWKTDGNKLLIYPTILFFLPNSEIDAMIRQLQEMRKQSQQETSDEEATSEEGEESL